ncbi:acetyltransferase (GNAT) family protein [Chitinophaga skermanii]|uniref:Acetyltransferase (GNAT) family protein n=1 Tax=Chitinophaga skermanii TaxID=331697 RepID=A0A327QVR5_9BACT|nr:GNAT family N-acetyltransferase [Chitinophaga skermanii]RAJ08431.1 acetyltransferase (GNAT) family protein [Chitinophaga skermanii]
MQVEIITHPDHAQLSEVRALYEKSFPPEERRVFDMLPAMLQNAPGMILAVFTADEGFVGFVVYWQFKRWAYIEHIAVNEEIRGKGYGKQMMQILQVELKGTIVLEVEKPYDDTAIRRIGFYERLGFVLAPYEYMQPPYKPTGAPIPMHLMSYPRALDEPTFLQYALHIRQQVYEYYY